MPDAYDQAVEYLTENPGGIVQAWVEGPNGDAETCRLFGFRGVPGACLFQYVGCGCLTMIRRDEWRAAFSAELTVAIRGDLRLPLDQKGITVDHLPIFAAYQRRADAIKGRTPPPLDPRLPDPRGDIVIPPVECSLAPSELGEAVKGGA
jgi:hypothetical protein